MTRMSSRPVSQTVVYAQDVAPSDTRDGVLWVDTASAENDLYTYDADAGEWVLSAPSNIAIQDTEPSAASLGDGWINTGQDPPEFLVYDGAGFNPPGTIPASVTDDGSDVTNYRVNDVSSGTYTLVDVTGSGVLLGGVASGDGSFSNFIDVRYTVDGGTSYTFSGVKNADDAGDQYTTAYLHPVWFTSSLLVEVIIPESPGAANAVVRQ